jgi:hypothetical protein
MKAYMVNKWTGEIKKGAEVRELAWVNSQNLNDYPVGTVLAKSIKSLEMIKVKSLDGLLDIH